MTFEIDSTVYIFILSGLEQTEVFRSEAADFLQAKKMHKHPFTKKKNNKTVHRSPYDYYH